jgi:hypothetical protein
MMCALGALALAGTAATAPAQARDFHPGFAGGVIAGALVAGAASSAYAYAPGPGYGYGYGYVDEGYPGPVYGGRGRGPYQTFGVYDESAHGGQPSYTRPLR